MARVSATESGSPNARRVRAHQVDLQFANLVADNAHVAELAHAGGDGVGDFVAGDDLIDHGARPVHSLARVRRQEHGTAFGRDFAHRFQREIVAVNVKCVQESFPSCFPKAARKAFKYFSGRAAIFISASVTICVVSPSASSVPSSARRNS